MSGLGKILIVLNLLAAGAFMYFSMENWKVRQELTYAAFRNEVQLRGIPLEAPANVTVDSESVPFVFTVNPNTEIDSIQKTTLDKLIPKGDDVYGGPPVADQTAELKRLREKIFGLITSADGAAEKRNQLKRYLVNYAKNGAERDGINALFDLKDAKRKAYARGDLPLAARTTGQVAALKALVTISDLQDPQAIAPAEKQASSIKNGRDAISQLLRGQISHGASNADDARTLTNAIIAALQPNAGEPAKQAIIDAAKSDTEGFKHLAELAVNQLTTKANVQAARSSILEYTKSQATSESEKTAMAELVNLIAPGENFVLDDSIEKVATALLTLKFDDAEAPAAQGKESKGNPYNEKAARIAHLLYHADAHRLTDPAAKDACSQWHTRVATIVGLPTYVRAAEYQASEYVEAANRLVALITEEQSSFESEFQARVQRSQFLYSQLASVQAQLKQQVAITTQNQTLLMERITERDKLKDELDKGREDAKTALAKLKDVQVKLFKVQKELKDAQEALLTMEKELRRIELGGGGGR